MYGTARRDIVFFQRGAGYASGLDPFQQGGRKTSKKTLHEIYCSKKLHAPHSRGKKKKSGRSKKRTASKKQKADAVVLRRSSRVRKPKMRGSGKKGGQKGGFGFLAGLGSAIVNGLAGMVVGGLQGVMGGVTQAGRGRKGAAGLKKADMYKGMRASFRKRGQVGSGKKIKAFFGKLKKVASKVASNPEVRKVAKNLIQKAADKGIDMIANKATQIKLVKDLMTPEHISAVKSIVNKQIGKL